MIDATTGQTGQRPPCPMCGSHDVRWRRRRWYDVVRNEVRYWSESLLSIVFGKPDVVTTKNMDIGEGREDFTLRFGTDEEVQALNSEMQYDVERGFYESHVASAVPVRFWRCRACKREGHEFADVAALLAKRERLAELEDGAMPTSDSHMYNGIDRTGLDRSD